MTNQPSNRRRSFPPYDESSKLSRRDQTLVRVEKLLSEQFITPLPDEAQFEEDGPVDLVDLDEAVETATLPPEDRPRPRVFTPPPPAAKPSPTESPAKAASPPAAPPDKKSRLSAFSAVLQGAILIFVLAWVFLLGILVGRGHLWQTGLGHDLVIWVEQKAGWSEKAGPEIVLKKDNQPDVVIPPAPIETPPAQPDEADPGTGSEGDVSLEPAAQNSGETAEDKDEMPVWNWPGWTPGPADDPLGGSEGAGGEAGPAPTSEAAPAGDAQAAETTAPAAPPTVTPAPTADEPEEETWPTAIEDDPPGPAVRFQPPSDHDEYENYDHMMEASEVPDATLAEATPLPPKQDGSPGTGKFAVQVARAANADEAQRKVNQLISQGFAAYYYDDGNGGFPVRVGHFATHQAANEAKVLLEQRGYNGPYVSALGN